MLKEAWRSLWARSYVLLCQTLRWWSGTSIGSGSSLLQVNLSHQGLNWNRVNLSFLDDSAVLIQVYFHILSCAAVSYVPKQSQPHLNFQSSLSVSALQNCHKIKHERMRLFHHKMSEITAGQWMRQSHVWLKRFALIETRAEVAYYYAY